MRLKLGAYRDDLLLKRCDQRMEPRYGLRLPSARERKKAGEFHEGVLEWERGGMGGVH